MKARLEGICSIDLPEGPPKLPEDPFDCWVVIEADVGVADEPGADIFTFYVCTIKKLQSIVEAEGYQLGRHLIVVNEFNWGLIERAISDLIDSVEGDSWAELAEKIGR